MDLERILEEKRRWEKECALRYKDQKERYRTISGLEIKNLYTPFDIKDLDYLKDLGFPGEYPFTRGIHGNMYRGKLWTIRQFSGFGTAKDTNERFKFLLKHGQTGLSTAFDMPTLMGLDSDHPLAEGEIGREGVAVDTLKDFEILFDGIPLDKVSTSFTINSPASIILAMYIAVGEKQGVPSHLLRGTIQNDILKEYHAQNEWIFPPEPSIKIITDIFEFAKDHLPKFNTISISGYHIREAGSTAVQELAFTLADGFAYVEAGIRRGLDVDEFASRLSFFFNAHMDFFEEIAKFRAARRIWAREMKERYKAKDPRSLMLRFHTQTAGCSLQAQQPLVNIIRTTLEALSAVLGGTQSLHTNSYDEALQLPADLPAIISLRTQQVIAYESGVINTVDPLAGSYFVEALTNKMEEEAYKYFDEILKKGNGSFLDGVLKGIEEGYFKREIANAAYEFQKRVESGDYIIVGVNKFVDPEEKIEVPPFRIDPDIERKQIEFLRKVKSERDNIAVKNALNSLKRAAERGDNLMPYIIECVKRYATEGEIVDTLKAVYGVYREKIVV
ncbi:MAG: methylmalonyl-CoA mutase family protein [Candidatus Hydrothermales bacterium]